MTLRLGWVALLGLLATAPAWPQSPPPRSARDITALLDSYQPDAQAVAALKAGADGKPAYAYAHPLFWAPFSVIGEGN